MPSTLAPEDQFATLNGLKLHYLDWGRPAGSMDKPPLLMVHGLAREAHSFDPIARHLSARFRCLSLDVRGRGDSEWAKPGEYGNRFYAADVRALLQHLGLPQVHYIGTSMGGMIAMELAVDTPQLFSSVTLNDIGPEIAAAGSDAVGKHVARAVQGFDSMEDVYAYEVARQPWYGGFTRAELEEAYANLVRPDANGRMVYRFDPNIAGGRASTEEARAAQAQRSWQGFRNFACPLLLVRGGETTLLKQETVASMRQAQPGMAFVEVPGVGHTPTLVEAPVLAAFDPFYTAAGA